MPATSRSNWKCQAIDQSPQLPEASLSPVASAWIRRQGFEVYAEAPHYSTSIDLVGVRWSDEAIITVELKTTLTHRVIHQAAINQLITQQSYTAVPTHPKARSLDAARRVGVGVIRVSPYESSRVVIQPRPLNHLVNRLCRDLLLDFCWDSEPGGTGGLPMLPAHLARGPVQRCHAKIMEYVAGHPTASWMKIFVAVPNHYCNALSLRSCMHKLENYGKVTERVGWRMLIDADARSR